MTREKFFNTPYNALLKQHDCLPDFFQAMALEAPPPDAALSLTQYFKSLDAYALQELGLDREMLSEEIWLFYENMQNRHDSFKVSSVTIVGGHNKLGEAENITLELKLGDVVSIVGPTGSGKSRLLGDVEWLAQGDTPTGRYILVNGQPPPSQWRYSPEHKLVAQLSQNMNFVMDLTVAEFVNMHGQSRQIKNVDEKVNEIIFHANSLAGEPLSADTPVTSLSGGQSRALMIADTAYLSTSPIVLIDEIENAGIDRKTAVELLVRQEKIVLIATHDPVLALSAPRRIVISNGGMKKLCYTTDEERYCLERIDAINLRLMEYRDKLRKGEEIKWEGS